MQRSANFALTKAAATAVALRQTAVIRTTRVLYTPAAAPLCCARVAPVASAGAVASLTVGARRAFTSSATAASSSSSSASAPATVHYAPSGPVSAVPVSCIEFPFVRGDPSSPSEAGRDYFAGNDVRDAPVVVLHGLLGSAGNWRTMAPKLSTRRRLISVDLRNHGTSPHANDMRFAALAADIVALLDARGVKKAVLLGHSLGGKVALACALLHPERVAGVIAVDMAPVRYQMGEAGWRGVAGIVDALHSTPLQRFRSRAEVDKYLQPLIPDFTTRAFVLQNAVVTSEPAAEGGSAKQSVSWRCNVPLLHAALPSMAEFSLAPEASSAQSLPPFAGPALFVGGGSSPYLRAEAHAATIKSMFPQAELTWIPQAGHWVHVEKPREFVQTVAPWLAKLEQRDDELHELNEQSPPHHQQQGHKQQAAQ